MAQTPNVKVPLVYSDGCITREWLPYLTQAANAAAAGDVSAVYAAIAALQASMTTADAALQAAINALAVSIAAIPSQDALYLRRPAEIANQPSDTQAIFAARIFWS